MGWIMFLQAVLMYVWLHFGLVLVARIRLGADCEWAQFGLPVAAFVIWLNVGALFTPL